MKLIYTGTMQRVAADVWEKIFEVTRAEVPELALETQHCQPRVKQGCVSCVSRHEIQRLFPFLTTQK